MTTRCPDHEIDYTERCPLCIAFEHFLVHRTSHSTIYRESWNSFDEWWCKDRDPGLRRLHEEQMADAPVAVFDDWAWDELPVVMRRTVAVVVCHNCDRFIEVKDWLGGKAHRLQPSKVTHGTCDACFDVEEGR